MDGCKDCIRYNEYELEVCEKCGHKTVEVKLDGPCLSMKCTNCDFSVVGASFYAACEVDDKKYKIAIDGQDISNKQIIEISTICKVSAMEVRKSLTECGYLGKEFWLFELVDIVQRFEEMGLKYMVEPELEYGRIFTCDRKIIFHRL